MPWNIGLVQQRIAAALLTNATVPGNASGGPGVTTTLHAFAVSSGTFVLNYDAFAEPDQIDIYYEGALIATTAGGVSGTGTLSAPFSGTERGVVVVVTSPPFSFWQYFLYYTTALPASAPPNDDWPNATVIDVSGPGQITGATLNASLQSGEATPNVFSTRSVWYTFTAPTSTTITFDTELSNPGDNTTLAVYTGASFGARVFVASDDDSGVGSTSLLALPVTSGVTYHIQICDAPPSSALPFILRWN